MEGVTMSLLYLTLDRYIDYDQFKPVSRTNNGGGMGAKTASAVNAWSRFYPVKASQEIEDGHDILVVEPLWFRLRGGMGRLTTPDIEEAINAYKANDASIKIVYTSETSLMKLNASQRDEIVNHADCVTANCLFQQKQFEMFGITTQYLSDNTPEELYYFPSARKTLSVVAMGRISTAKNSQKVADIFKALAGKGIERVYIGSASLWGDAAQEDAMIEKDIMANCDRFHYNIPGIQVGRILSEMACGIFDPFHDCSSTSNSQALMAGILCFYGLHGLWKERPGVHNLDSVSEFVDAIERCTDGFKKPPAQPTRKQIEDWAINDCGNNSFLRQWEGVLKHARK